MGGIFSLNQLVGARVLYLMLILGSAPLAYAQTQTQKMDAVEFNLEVDAQLRHIKVTLRNPADLALSDRRINFALIKNATTCSGETLRKRLLAQAHCARYEVRLPRGTDSRFQIDVPRDVRLINPEHFLFSAARAHVRIDSPVPISHPWLEVAPDTFAIVPSPRSSSPEVIIGAFHAIDIPGLRKPVAYVGDARFVDKMRLWLTPVVAIVGYEQQFPNPDVQVIAMSVRAHGNSPVPFGHVVRNQGETVRFFVDPSRTLTSLHYDWTAAHELAHLQLPYLSGTGRWLSEGFASYYQNVLQARLGYYSEEEAWRRLGNSFRRASVVGEDMSPNGATREAFWKSRLMIYWSGAAFALLADVALRQQNQSLDEVLARLDVPQPRSWQPRELIRELDRLSSTDIFSRLYAQHANDMGMPPTDDVFAAMGIGASGDLDNTAPLAKLRRAIVASQHEDGTIGPTQ